MRRLIEADMHRVLTKIVPWVLLLLCYVVTAVATLTGIDTSPDRNFFVLSNIETGFKLSISIIGFATLLGIYADEYKSMVMIGVIGRGISRDKFVLGKFGDLCVMTFLMEFLTVAFLMMLKVLLGAVFSPIENRFLVILFTLGFIETVSYVTLAAFFYFLSENAAVGMFAYLTFVTIIPVTLSLILSTGNFGRLELGKYYLTGMISAAFSDFVMGDYAEGMGFTLLAIAVYILCSLGITILVFRKKELEF